MAVTSRSNWGGNETDSAYWHTIANITLRKDGIWNLAQTPPLRSVMFAVNNTTRAASHLDYLQFCSSQPLLSPGTVHQIFE